MEANSFETERAFAVRQFAHAVAFGQDTHGPRERLRAARCRAQVAAILS